MTISPLELVNPALARTRKILFRPFDPMKWLVIGFGCWLAQLASGGSSGARWGLGSSPETPPGEPASFPDWLDWFDWGALGVGLLVSLAVLALVLIVALLWLSSRGKFVFLDNVAFDRAAIVVPWKRHAAASDSLFLWRLAFLGVVLLAVLLCVGAFLLGGAAWWVGDHAGLSVLGLVIGGLTFGLLVLASLAVALLLDSFVVPVMAAEGLSCQAAWRRFLALFRPHVGTLVLYGLIVLVFYLALAAAIIMLGFATCCLGFVLLAIPYVGTVVLLPVHVFFRCYSLEILAAVEPRWNLFESASWSTERGAPPPPAEPERFTV